MKPLTMPVAAALPGNSPLAPSQASSAGTLPNTDTQVINSVTIGTPVPGGGEVDAPSVTINVDLASGIMSAVTEVRVILEGPSGRIASARAEAADGDNLEFLTIELDEYDPSGEWALREVEVEFDTAVNNTYPSYHTFEANDLSSLMTSRFVDLEVPDADFAPPSFSDLDLPSRSFTVGSDNPFSTNDGDSVEISFDLFTEDPKSGLNLIDFEFDIGPGSPAVVGGEWGLFGDISGGLLDLSTFNTAAPAGDYQLTRLRISDDQGNTHVLSTDDLQELGYETVVNVAPQDALEDSAAPTVSSFSMDQTVTVTANGGSLIASFVASDDGLDDTGVTSVSLALQSSVGGLYQLNAAAVLDEGGQNWIANFEFDKTFPAGDFTIVRLSVNDAAFNRASVALDDTSFTVINPYGGDIADNRLKGDGANNAIDARSGDDTVTGGDGDDTINLGAGNDVAWAGAGDSGNDTVIGDAGNDIIAGGDGDDLLIGGAINSADYRDIAFTAFEERLDGNDVLFGGAGNDTLYGGSPTLDRDPVLETGLPGDGGSTAANALYAGTGDDIAQGSRGGDTIGGGSGNDTLVGLEGHDIIYGGAGDTTAANRNDVIRGGEGDDIVFASGGNDNVWGGADNDALFGGAGDDNIWGDGGHDEIYGGAGNDLLNGGSGNDQFFFAEGSGADNISDFDVGDDTLALTGYADRFASSAEVLASATVTTQNGVGGLLIDLEEGDSVFLVGVLSTVGVSVVI